MRRAGGANPGVMVVTAACLLLVAAGSWWWQASVRRAPPREVAGESWERVKDEYPLAAAPAEPTGLVEQAAETALHANPFSPERRRVVVPQEGGGQGEGGGAGSIPEPPTPQFAYKGRVVLGTRQRAVVEETGTHKTYFLEVGQEVAGFKVLDIAENRVVLSHLQTNEEVVVSLTPTTAR